MRWLKFIAKLVGRVSFFGVFTSIFGWLIGSFIGVIFGNPKIITEILIVIAVCVVLGFILTGLGKYLSWSFSPPLLEKKK